MNLFIILSLSVIILLLGYIVYKQSKHIDLNDADSFSIKELITLLLNNQRGNFIWLTKKLFGEPSLPDEATGSFDILESKIDSVFDQESKILNQNKGLFLALFEYIDKSLEYTNTVTALAKSYNNGMDSLFDKIHASLYDNKINNQERRELLKNLDELKESVGNVEILNTKMISEYAESIKRIIKDEV